MSAAFELIDGIPNYNLYVGGKWVRSSRNEAVESRNPATGELFAKVQQAGAAETELAISAAHGAYKAWAATPISAREAIFFRAADVLAAKTKEIVEVLIQESGSIAGKAGFEVGYCFDLLRTAAAEMRRSAGETMPLTAPGQFGFTVRQPLGVIAGIAPFNAPFLLAMKKVVLALAAGNGFILKPSELTPVTGLKIAEVFDEAGLPPGLLSVVPGLASEVGAAIFADPGADDHVHRLNPDRSPSRRRSGEDAQTSAGIIPYPDVGTINPAVYIFTAANTGLIAAFFVGSSASLEENIGLLVNGVPTGLVGLDNHTSSPGDEFNLGMAHAGDTLTFVMFIPPAVNSTGPFTWSSNSADNSDMTQHIYSTMVTAGQAFAGSPAGTYIGWEDLPASSADFDYNDDQYLFVNVKSTVPEASTWVMMLAGFGGLALAASRRARKTGVSAIA